MWDTHVFEIKFIYAHTIVNENAAKTLLEH